MPLGARPLEPRRRQGRLTAQPGSPDAPMYFSYPNPFLDWIERQLAALGALGVGISFAVLFSGAALAAYYSGLAAMVCGSACTTSPSLAYPIAALFGGAIVLFAKVYAVTAAFVQRVFIDPFEFTKPAPMQQDRIAGWVWVVYLVIGVIVSVGMFAFADKDAGMVNAMLVGWILGRGALDYFWRRRPDPIRTGLGKSRDQA